MMTWDDRPWMMNDGWWWMMIMNDGWSINEARRAEYECILTKLNGAKRSEINPETWPQWLILMYDIDGWWWMMVDGWQTDEWWLMMDDGWTRPGGLSMSVSWRLWTERSVVRIRLRLDDSGWWWWWMTLDDDWWWLMMGDDDWWMIMECLLCDDWVWWWMMDDDMVGCDWCDDGYEGWWLMDMKDEWMKDDWYVMMNDMWCVMMMCLIGDD